MAELTDPAALTDEELAAARLAALRGDLLGGVEGRHIIAALQAARAKIKNQRDRINYLEGATHHATGTPLSLAIERAEKAEAQLTEREQQLAALREAAQKFVDKVREVEDSESVKAVYVMAFAHGAKHLGPTWEAEEKELREALTSTAALATDMARIARERDELEEGRDRDTETINEQVIVIEGLTEQLTEARATLRAHEETIAESKTELAKAHSIVGKLQVALSYYAEGNFDAGTRARDALAASPPGEYEAVTLRSGKTGFTIRAAPLPSYEYEQRVRREFVNQVIGTIACHLSGATFETVAAAVRALASK